MTGQSSKPGPKGAMRRGSVPGLLDGWDATAAAKPRKRSLAIAGHRTSISLEEPFWDGLRSIADTEGVPLATLVAAIDAARGEASLSSALRLFVFARLCSQPKSG